MNVNNIRQRLRAILYPYAQEDKTPEVRQQVQDEVNDRWPEVSAVCDDSNNPPDIVAANGISVDYTTDDGVRRRMTMTWAVGAGVSYSEAQLNTEG